jgi:hypothetical protein
MNPACPGGTDCDDTDLGVFPGAPESGCDLVDNDCDGDALDGAADDDDDDVMDIGCAGGTDCDDDDVTAFPGAARGCSADHDCDTLPDQDQDLDGYVRVGCAGGDDCDDDDADVHPGALEVCHDPVDVDCDGLLSEAHPVSGDVRVTSDDAHSRTPCATWTGSELHVAWSDDRSGDYEIWLQAVQESGVGTGSAVRVTTSVGSSGEPSLAWSGSTLGLAWTDTRDGNEEIYLAVLDRAGARLGNDVRMSVTSNDSYAPSIVWTGAGWSLAWVEYHALGVSDLVCASLSGDGTRLAPDVMVESGPEAAFAPDLEWTGSEVGVAWADFRYGSAAVMVARLQPDGTRIGTDARVTTAGAVARDPALTWADGAWGVAWVDSRTGIPSLVFKAVSPAGADLCSEAVVSTSLGFGTRPSLEWTGSEYGLAWTRGDVSFVTISGSCSVLGARVTITEPAAYAESARLVWADGFYGAFWTDSRDFNEEIYFGSVGICE